MTEEQHSRSLHLRDYCWDLTSIFYLSGNTNIIFIKSSSFRFLPTHHTPCSTLLMDKITDYTLFNIYPLKKKYGKKYWNLHFYSLGITTEDVRHSKPHYLPWLELLIWPYTICSCGILIEPSLLKHIISLLANLNQQPNNQAPYETPQRLCSQYWPLLLNALFL